MGREKEITQAEFTGLCGVNRQAWNNAETGDARIGIDSAMAVVRRTGATLDYIYLGDSTHLPHRLAVEIEQIEAAEKKSAKRA